MVKNQNLVLDEGKIKYVDEYKMSNVSRTVLKELQLMQSKKWTKKVWEVWDSDDEDDPLAEGIWKEYEEDNPNYKAVTGIIKDWWQKWEPGGDMHTLFYYQPKRLRIQRLESWDAFYEKEKETIYRFLGRIPYNPSVMINISPNWKGHYGQDPFNDEMMTERFQEVIDKYLKASNRYSKYKYVLECGGDGDHLHAHIVAEIREGMYKSVMTHINKGNHAVELRKIWDKAMPKGKQGLIKGKHSVQRIILRNELLRNDKLDYLIEEKKPEGHKNAEDLEILVSVGF